ncbi:MAG: threonine synthase, partial [Bacteroidota bacterium]
VSPLQEKQLTTLGHNIQALAIEGTFDDCQTMVKQAFLDPQLRQHRRLTSANSINISRLIPQSFYYFRAWQQMDDRPLTFVVPSGNFGNLTGGLFAWKMGLPVERFIAATNVNDTVPSYLHTGAYLPKPSVQTYANAMDVGNPSNFVRMAAIFGQNRDEMTRMIAGASFGDAEILATIQSVYARTGYELDPHTAVGYLAWQSLRDTESLTEGIILGTAHPAKFQPVMKQALDRAIDLPVALANLRHKTPDYLTLPPDFSELKAFLMTPSS